MARFHLRQFLLLACGFALSAAVSAAVEQIAPPAPGAELDTVEVIGKKRGTLQREVIEAEDRFYKRFNALNANDDFDIRCRKEKPPGTNVPQRQCRIRFLVEAGSQDSREFFRGLFQGRGFHQPIAALSPEWQKRRDAYRQSARTLLQDNPDLLALGTEWVKLQQQYLLSTRR